MATQDRNIRYTTYTRASQKLTDMAFKKAKENRMRYQKPRRNKQRDGVIRINPAPDTRSPLFWRLF